MKHVKISDIVVWIYAALMGPILVINFRDVPPEKLIYLPIVLFMIFLIGHFLKLIVRSFEK